MANHLKEYKIVLGVFALGVLNGVIEKQQIIDWADDIIRREEAPDFLIIELSLINTKSNSDIISLLNEYKEDSIPLISARVYLGMFYYQLLKGKLELPQAVNAIYHLVHTDFITSYEEGKIYTIEYENDSIGNGYFNITIDDVKANTLEFLSLYKEFKLDNVSDWESINSNVELKIELLEKKQKDYLKESQIETLVAKHWWKFW
jgi:hypothetical protein